MASEAAITTTSPTTPDTAGPAQPAPPTTPPVVRDPAGPILVVLLLLLAAMTGLTIIRNSDALQHLALGRLLTQGTLPLGTDPLTAPGEATTSAHHSWLFDLLLYALYAVGGGVLLVLVKAGLTVLIVEQQRRVAHVPNTQAAPVVVCLLLGLVVLNPYLLVQSRFASIVLLSTLVYFLSRFRADVEESAAPPVWALPVLCLAWGNLDPWFFLGPLAIGLYLCGTLLEERLQPTRADGSPRPRHSRTLVVAFVASIVAICLNPGLLARRFDLPPELGLNGALAYVAGLPGFTALTASPLGSDYFTATTGWSIAGQGYFVLLLLSLASFALLGSRLPWGPFFLVLALALLSLYRVAAIPFFAVAATPWLARCVQEMLAAQAAAQPTTKRDDTGGVLLAGLLLVLAGVATYPGWLNAWPWTQWRVGVGIEEDAGLREMAQKVGELGQWYQETTGEPAPVWLNTSPAAAHYIAWYAPGQRTYIDQRLALSVEAARDFQSVFLAPWKRSQELGAYLQAQQQGKKPPAFTDPYEALRKRGIRFLAFHQANLITALRARAPGPDATLEERARRIPLVQPLFQSLFPPFSDWTLLHVRGATSLFGFRAARPDEAKEATDTREAEFRKKLSEKGLRFAALAFGPAARPVPLEGPAQEPEARTWLTTLWSPEPLRNADAQEAAQFNLLFTSTRELIQFYALRDWDEFIRPRAVAFTLPHLTGLAWPLVPGALWQQLSLGSGFSVRDYKTPFQLYFDDRDHGSAADLYLTLRAARASLADNPFDAQAHTLLAETYFELAHNTRENFRGEAFALFQQLRRYQTIAAAQAAIRLDFDLERAHELLAVTYLEMGYRDLHLDHLREAVRCNVAAGPLPGESTEQAEKRWDQMNKRLTELDKEIEQRERTFTLETRSARPLEKAFVAIQPRAGYNLGGKMIEILAELREKQEELNVPIGGQQIGPQMLIESFLLSGNLAAARAYLDPSNQKAFGPHPNLGLSSYEWFRFCLGACSGDYALADEALDALLTEVRAAPDFTKSRSDASRWLAGAVASLAADRFLGLPPHAYLPPPVDPAKLNQPVGTLRFVVASVAAQLTLRPAAIESALLTLRGGIALETGRIDRARTAYQEAVRLGKPPGVVGVALQAGWRAVPLAEYALELLDRGRELAKAP